MGAKYVNETRFKPLHGDGKPLWEFKEHDHRLYCIRFVETGDRADVVLLNGWIKDKEGKTKRENSQIATAKTLYAEYQPSGGR